MPTVSEKSSQLIGSFSMTSLQSWYIYQKKKKKNWWDAEIDNIDFYIESYQHFFKIIVFDDPSGKVKYHAITL